AFDLTADIASANSRRAALNEGTAALVRGLSPPDAPAAALLITGNVHGRAKHPPRLVLANASLDDPVRVPVAPLLLASGLDGTVLEDDADDVPIGPGKTVTIRSAEVRTLHVATPAPIGRHGCAAAEAAAMPRVAIEGV